MDASVPPSCLSLLLVRSAGREQSPPHARPSPHPHPLHDHTSEAVGVIQYWADATGATLRPVRRCTSPACGSSPARSNSPARSRGLGPSRSPARGLEPSEHVSNCVLDHLETMGDTAIASGHIRAANAAYDPWGPWPAPGGAVQQQVEAPQQQVEGPQLLESEVKEAVVSLLPNKGKQAWQRVKQHSSPPPKAATSPSNRIPL